MGGFAFASGPNSLKTPRMPLAVYLAVKSRCETILKQRYRHVATPIEGPGKKDYGDVDFLVTLPTLPLCHHDSSIAVWSMGKALGAERSITNKSSPTTNFALPWPTESQGEATASLIPPDEEIFVQVDVHVCQDKGEWDWKLFDHAHGDLWVILRSIIQKHGLKVNNVGLFLRIEEIEQTDGKRSMVLLTKNPSDVLSFLGLDESSWWHQFESAQAMFEYAATCRYFRADDAMKSEIADDSKALKSKDRKIMSRRPFFRKWVEEFIPPRRTSGAYNRPVPSRKQIRDEAFERFGVKDLYDQKLDTWRREIKTDEIWRNAIRAGLPTAEVDPDLVAASIKGLRATVIKGDRSYAVVTPIPQKTADGFYEMEALVEFFKREWKHVGVNQLEKQRVRVAEKVEDTVRGRSKNERQMIQEPQTHSN